MTSYRVALIAAALLGGVFSSGAASAQELPKGEGSEIVLNACTMCHGADVIVSQRRSSEEWSQVVARMVGNGANLTDDQYKTVVAYLSKTLGTDTAPSAAATSPAAPAAPVAPAAH
jgi:mono/diheme cytochrome c family protein